METYFSWQYVWQCTVYIIVCGILSFWVGRMLPKSWFRYDAFPYRGFRFEKNGKVYAFLQVRRWQSHVPDMSVPFHKMMQQKKMTANFKEELPNMVQETCVAELTHMILAIAGFYCIRLWPGWIGVGIAIGNAAVNYVFVIVQRYNRPILVALMLKVEANRNKREGKVTVSESSDIKCEYGGRA